MENKHKEIVKRVVKSFHIAKRGQENLSLAYCIGGEWAYTIQKNRKKYLDALKSSDIPKLDSLLRNFFRNEGSDGINDNYPGKENPNVDFDVTMEFVRTILQDYEIWNRCVNGKIEDVSVPNIGNPWGCYINENLIMRYSFRQHRFALMVNDLLIDVKNPTVAEIGGGYGGFAYYLIKAMENVKYINFDIPEILLINSYYLLNAFPKKKILLYGEYPIEKITSNISNSFDMILLPNFELPKLLDNSIDLFINTGSLSEMDYITIEEYISQIVRTTKKYFFHENSNINKMKDGNFIEIPASQFPIPNNIFRLVTESPSLLTAKRYNEYLFERIEYH